MKILELFLAKSSNLLTGAFSVFSSQLCESLNIVKARYTQKASSWGASWNGRI
jgi:hypothetical protein